MVFAVSEPLWDCSENRVGARSYNMTRWVSDWSHRFLLVTRWLVSHPFFRRSFVPILIFTWVLCTALCFFVYGGLGEPRKFVVSTNIWFIFYLLSTWLSAAIILLLRRRFELGWHVELIICILCFCFGYQISEYLRAAYQGHPPAPGIKINIWGSWAAIAYFVVVSFENRHKYQESKRLLAEAQSRSLTNLLSPHFLFNSLNTVSAFVKDMPDRAEDAIHDLSDVLRYTMLTAETSSVPLAKEFTIMRSYLSIERYRFGEQLSFSFDLPQELESTPIPPLLIQPAVENITKHAIALDPVHIDIRAYAKGQYRYISISDNGPGFPEEQLEGIGQGGLGLRLLELRALQLRKGTMRVFNSPGANVLIRWEAN